ncbi:MAG: hypothetical protein IPI58_00685 [Alphaproteobacteria bacterium]|nr:MAG: hypothetical protein IPI58_00685 [Alphaproteobacteria bacterium]
MSFAFMIAALFADPVLSKPAVYQPQAGSVLTLRVMAKQPDVLTGFGDGQIHTATALFDVQTAEVAQPMVGDRLTVDGSTFIVQSEPTADRDRLIWTLNTRPE